MTAASQRADQGPPYALGTVWAFQAPPSMSRLPMPPKGVSARAANAATLAGSTYTGRRRDGMNQGRLPMASVARVTAARRVLLVRTAAGIATRAVMAMAAKPPITAGRRARARRAA